jgi:LacI family transcriptional regulator
MFDLDGICSVVTDNTEGAMQATRYLVDLGHRDIVYVTRPLLVSSLRDRCDGFRRAIRDRGIAPEERQVVTVRAMSTVPSGKDAYLEGAYNAVGDLLRNRSRFTAVFAADDIMALGAKKAIEDAGLRVPGDISVIGYDDISIAHIADLTTVSQPAYELGRNSAILLIDLIEGRVKPPRHVTLRPSIVIRRTCRRID